MNYLLLYLPGGSSNSKAERRRVTTALAPRTTLQRGHTHSPLKGAVGNKARPVLFLTVAYQRNHRHLVGWIREQYGIDGCSFVQRQITVARDQYLQDVHAALRAHSSAPLCQLHVSYMYPSSHTLGGTHIYSASQTVHVVHSSSERDWSSGLNDLDLLTYVAGDRRSYLDLPTAIPQ